MRTTADRLQTTFTMLCVVGCVASCAGWGVWPFVPLFPFGWCAVALAVLPAWRLAVARRRDANELHRMDHGLCLACGYDLRGATARCPECGRPFQPHEAVSVPKG